MTITLTGSATPSQIRPIIFYDRFATCWQPYVKGPTMMVDSLFNSNRREDWWLVK